MPELAYINGRIFDIDDAQVPIEDRGYQFGDAVYEFITSYNGKMFHLEEHLDRLERSMQGLAFPPISRLEIKEAVLRIFDRAGFPRAGIYLQVSRGVAPRIHAFPQVCRPQLVMTVRAIEEKPLVQRQNGVAAITVEDVRWGRCDLKTVQLLPNVLAKQKAVDAGVYDAVFVSDEKIVREATSSNVFAVMDGIVVTHPLTPAILPGITRRVVLDLCRELGILSEERFFRIDEMLAAHEAFLTGTTTEVLPLVEVDGKPIGNGRVGQVTNRLYAALLEHAGA